MNVTYHIKKFLPRLVFGLALAALSFVLANNMKAETVSQKEAKAIATKFFNAAHGKLMAEPKLVYNGRRLTTGSYFAPFYIYNLPVGGFVVISAENKAFPILGYSLIDSFSPDKMGEKEKALLTMYARHIENIRYDSSTPYEAMAAWQNINEYINDILTAPYNATDPVTSSEEALAELEYVSEKDDAAASASATYSSDQWMGMLNDELTLKADVPLGLVTADEDIVPAVVYGRKGDMYRILLDERDKALWRLLPTEVISSGQLAVFGNPPVLPEVNTEELPFTFYNDFLNQIAEEELTKAAAIDPIPVIGDEPIVQWHGSGHFTVILPEEVKTMRVYSLDGQLVQRDAFRETNVANVELTQNPTGFYFAVFFGESGIPYAVKLFR